jgi:NHS family xanthosine MFS transporter
MMVTNGIGAVLGALISGWLIQTYYTSSEGNRDWHGIWLAFSIYVFVVAILFFFFFKHKHDSKLISTVTH